MSELRKAEEVLRRLECVSQNACPPDEKRQQALSAVLKAQRGYVAALKKAVSDVDA